MKKGIIYIGVDVSKSTLDVCVLQEGSTAHYELGNTKEEIWLFFKGFEREQVKVCCENTGKYSWVLLATLRGQSITVYQVNGLHLKRSMGLVRGKDDVVDAYRIAVFLSKNHEELSPYQERDRELLRIKVLLSKRDLLVKQRAQHKAVEKEGEILSLMDMPTGGLSSQDIIDYLTEKIREIERLIAKLVRSNALLKRQNEIMTSIPGVGTIVAWHVLVKTNGFRSITQARKFACYSGVAPFHHRSGTSVYTRPKVSHYADKSMKKLLHMAAITAVHRENDLRDYYLRKLEEGKNKMLVLNAVRNKIIQRIFAMVKSGKKYQINLDLT